MLPRGVQPRCTLHDALIRRNEDIGVKDVLIAAACLVNDVPLLTSNEHHFRRVPELTVITPSEFAVPQR